MNLDIAKSVFALSRAVVYPRGNGVQPSPTFFRNMILEVCPKMVENFSRRAFPGFPRF